MALLPWLTSCRLCLISYVLLPNNLGTVVFAGYVRNGKEQIANKETESAEIRWDVLKRAATIVYYYFLYSV